MGAILVTGANGHLGRRLIPALLARGDRVVAVVRRERAREILVSKVGEHAQLDIRHIDPSDATALATAMSGCSRAVHLIGTIREMPGNAYADSHQRPAAALLQAASTRLEQVVYLSILGADAAAACRCLAARAQVERQFAAADTPACLIRVPMVLGEGDRASAALGRRARATTTFVFRGASREQPIYAGDVIDALVAALGSPPAEQLFDLAGPESLSRSALIRRAARVVGGDPRIVSLPLVAGLIATRVGRWLNPRAPVTPDMLRVLDHDDAIDPHPAARALGIGLTSLDDMLAACLTAPANHGDAQTGPQPGT